MSLPRRRRLRAGLAAVAIVAAALALEACGKKGPPLPPLVLLPAAPGEFSVVRRGPRADLTFRIPKSNTDSSTPADLVRVDIFAWTVPGPVTGDEVVRRGMRVGSLAVEPPADPDEPEPPTRAPRREGLEQDKMASFSETLPPGGGSAYRAYVAVGFNARGRRGALSPRIALPLVPPPPAPPKPEVTYDEKTISVAWSPVVPAEGSRDMFAYSVYRPDSSASGVALTREPLAEPLFADPVSEWDKERCYEVRTVAMTEGVRIESDASPATCVTPRDTFPPSRPQGLVGVASEGAISLIWTANAEPDLAGYVVLRAVAPAAELTAVTPSPIADTNFRDVAPAGARVTYAVQSVDKSGNRSAPSDPITETAR